MKETGVARYVSIAESIRREILSGERPIGSRLPSERALASQCEVAHMTIRQALGVLEDSGLIERFHGRGTFVRSASAHLTVGLVFGPSLADESAYFYRAVLKALTEESTNRNYSCRNYNGLTDLQGKPNGANCPSLRHLRRDVDRGDLNGVIEFSPGVAGLSYEDPGQALPKARYEPGSAESDTAFDTYRFGCDAIRHLANLGRKQISYLRTSRLAVNGSSLCSSDLDGMFDTSHDLGLPVPQIENIVFNESFAHRGAEIHQCTMEMIRGWKKTGKSLASHSRALIVSDDICMRMVAMALVQSGLEIPKDLVVVCLTNEMSELHYGIPVIRYEMPIHILAKNLLSALNYRIHGKSPKSRLVAGAFQKSETSPPSLT